MELGKLQLISPRKKWRNEAQDFTPWLADNIKELNEALGLELEVENTEVAVGPYSADILAKDTGTDRYVVIENQLGKTDHDHLGKSITYASVLDASTIIWIATDFSEEHKKSLDWLNDHTSDRLSFYGVQLELWQIDESKAAVRFNVVCRPNQVIRQAAKSIAEEGLSETRKFQLEFWNKFKDKLAKTKKIPSLPTPRPQNWFDITLGKSHIHISATCNTWDNTAGVKIYIGNKIADEMLPFLESKKTEIEEKLGNFLQWNPDPNRIDKTIVLYHPTDFKDPQKIDAAIDWLVEYIIKFYEIFRKIIHQKN